MTIRKTFEIFSQSFFIKNAYFGAWILFSICLISPGHALLGVIGALLSGFVTRLSQDSQPWELRDFGIIPLNGFFYGLLFASYFVGDPESISLLILGSLLIPSVVRSLHFTLQGIKLPVLILPSLLLFLLMALIQGDHLRSSLIEVEGGLNLRLSGSDPLSILKSLLQALGWWFFIPDYRLGALLSAGLLVARPRLLMIGFFGVSLAMGIGWALFPENRSQELSQLAFSSGVVALGLASFPQKVRLIRIGIASVFACLLSALWQQKFLGFGLPFVSLPYIISMWGALLSLRPSVRISKKIVEANPINFFKEVS